MVAAFIIGLLLLVAVVYAVTLYNHLVMLKHNVTKAWSNIDVLLKQRYDELPKLVAVCQQHMQFEKTLFANIAEARTAAMTARRASDRRALGAVETVLRKHTGQLMALAESYPELRSDQTFQQLSARISELETAIADRRVFYNDTVQINNAAVEQFPGNFFSFKRAPRLEFSVADRSDVSMRNA